MNQDVRAAIFDTADDTRQRLSQLKTRGIEVIIRYLALGKRGDLPEHRLIDNGTPGTKDSEAWQILDKGLGLLLVYEWGNNTPAKFVFGLDATGKPKTGPSTLDNATIIKTAQAEADADIAAANAQAAAIGYPNAPVYFTIDFDLLPGVGTAKDSHGDKVFYSDNVPVTNNTAVTACTAYFERLNAKFGKARLGIYAGGWASLQLHKFVTYSWVAQSAGFTGTASYLRTGPWHLFQQRDAAWFLVNGDCSKALDVDTDIQNPSVTDIGAFGKSGSYIIDAARTQAIFDARRVATAVVPVYPGKNATPPTVQLASCHNGHPTVISEIGKNCSVRVLDDDGTWLSVDLDEDGASDGYALSNSFVKNIKKTPDYA